MPIHITVYVAEKKDTLQPSKELNIKGPDHLFPGRESWQISGFVFNS